MNITDLKARLNDTGKTSSLVNHFVFNGRYPLDLTEMPLDTVSDLEGYPSKYKFIGKKVKVLNTDTDNIMTEYWWNGSEWKLVETGKDYDAEIAALKADVADLQSADTEINEEIEEIHEILSGMQVASATTIIVQSASTTIYTYQPPSGDPIEVETEEEAKEMAKASGGTYTTTEVTTEEKTVTNTYITDINVDGSDMEKTSEE